MLRTSTRSTRRVAVREEGIFNRKTWLLVDDNSLNAVYYAYLVRDV
jgi:hypothetical protein